MVDIHLHYTEPEKHGGLEWVVPPVPGSVPEPPKSKYQITLKPYDNWRKKTRWSWDVRHVDRLWAADPMKKGYGKTREQAYKTATGHVEKLEAKDRRKKELADATEVLAVRG